MHSDLKNDFSQAFAESDKAGGQVWRQRTMPHSQAPNDVRIVPEFSWGRCRAVNRATTSKYSGPKKLDHDFRSKSW
jgi:hypothetical protein